ncbi:putative HD domain-containing protein [Azospirillaceae bacterium]
MKLAVNCDLQTLVGFLDEMADAVMLTDGQGQAIYQNMRFVDLYYSLKHKHHQEISCVSPPVLPHPLSSVLERISLCDGVQESQRSQFVQKRVFWERERQTHSWDIRRDNVSIFHATGQPINNGAYVFIVREITENHMIRQSLNRAHRSTLMALANLAEYRDADTGDHVMRVSRSSYEIGRALRDQGHFPDVLSNEFLDALALATILHDIGKVSIPDDILFKPGLLTSKERQTIETHTLSGWMMLTKANAFLADSLYFLLARNIARHHHERFDGSGYPDCLSGDAIPLEARIVAVADVFDALTSHRPYKSVWEEEKAISFLVEKAGTFFDPRVVNAFVAVLQWRAQAPLLHWDHTMSIGEQSVDDDHKTLIGLINQLDMARNASGHTLNELTLELVLDELISYTIMHFEREEAYMTRLEYPEISLHTQIHRIMAARVAEIVQHYKCDGVAAIGADITKFLSDWLRHHILKEDKKIGIWALSRDKTSFL